MIKRKLVMACLFVLAVQLARVCLLADKFLTEQRFPSVVQWSGSGKKKR